MPSSLGKDQRSKNGGGGNKGSARGGNGGKRGIEPHKYLGKELRKVCPFLETSGHRKKSKNKKNARKDGNTNVGKPLNATAGIHMQKMHEENHKQVCKSAA